MSTDQWDEAVRQGKIGAALSTQMAGAEKEKSKLIRTELSLFGGLLLSLMIWVAFRLFKIYMELKDMINFIDQGRAEAKRASDPSQYYTTSSGFRVAFSYFYPHMNLFSPFRNNSWPNAMVWAYYTSEWAQVMRSDVRNVQKLWIIVDEGSPVGDRSTLNAICTWLNQVGHPSQVCEKPCQRYWSPSWGSVVSDGMTGGMAGAFAGHGFGYGIEGAFVGVAATIGLGLTRGWSNYGKCKSQVNCLEKSCSWFNWKSI